MPSSWEPSERYDEWDGCRFCLHWRGGKCITYPNRIPLMLISGQSDHMVPRPAQVGSTLFEPIDFEEWRRTGRRVPAASPTKRPVEAHP